MSPAQIRDLLARRQQGATWRDAAIEAGCERPTEAIQLARYHSTRPTYRGPRMARAGHLRIIALRATGLPWREAAAQAGSRNPERDADNAKVLWRLTRL